VNLILIFGLVFVSLGCVRADDAEYRNAQAVARSVVATLRSGQTQQFMSQSSNYTAILEKAAVAYPNDPLIEYGLGSCYMCRKDSAAGAATMEKAYMLSHDTEIGLMYGLALKMNKQPLKACKLGEDMIAAHPDIPQLRMFFATVSVSVQKYDEALTSLRWISDHMPPSVPDKDKMTVFLLMGICYNYKGDHTNAVQKLQKAVLCLPNAVVPLNALGEALKINPKFPPSLFYKGVCLERRGDVAGAETYFRDSLTHGKERLEIGSDNGEDYYLVGLACDKLGMKDDAKAFRQKARELNFTFEAPDAH
jgi:tetratricopeptide (TPR) repeat protein